MNIIQGVRVPWFTTAFLSTSVTLMGIPISTSSSPHCWRSRQFCSQQQPSTCEQYIEGILWKGPYLPCVSMAGRALLAGYHRYHAFHSSKDIDLEQIFYFLHEMKFPVTYHFHTTGNSYEIMQGGGGQFQNLTRCFLGRCIISIGYCNVTLQRRDNECDGVSNHRCLECLLNRFFKLRSKKTSQFRVTDLCEGNPPVTRWIPLTKGQ